MVAGGILCHIQKLPLGSVLAVVRQKVARFIQNLNSFAATPARENGKANYGDWHIRSIVPLLFAGFVVESLCRRHIFATRLSIVPNHARKRRYEKLRMSGGKLIQRLTPNTNSARSEKRSGAVIGGKHYSATALLAGFVDMLERKAMSESTVSSFIISIAKVRLALTTTPSQISGLFATTAMKVYTEFPSFTKMESGSCRERFLSAWALRSQKFSASCQYKFASPTTMFGECTVAS